MPLVQVASPRIVVFFVRNPTTGAPVTGGAGACTFELYTDDQGTAIVPQPVISEIGNGLYKFTPLFSTNGLRGLVYVLNTGAGTAPGRVWEYLRPEVFDEDKMKVLLQAATGQWKIHTSGPNVNQLVMYDNDGVTILFKFNLLDVSGSPTTVNPYSAVPV